MLNRLLVLVVAVLLAACGGPESVRPAPEKPAPQAARPSDLPAVALTPDVLYFLLLGEIAGHRGRLDVSVPSLANAARKTRDPRIAERAALAALYARDAKLALETSKLWVELRPNHIEAHEAYASALLESGQPQAARDEYLATLARVEPARRGVTLLRFAGTLSRYGNRQQAHEVMQALAGRYDNLPEAWLAAAHLAVRAGELEEADRNAATALRQRPGWEEAALFRARVLSAFKNPARLKAFYEEFLKARPDSVAVRMGYARQLVDLQQLDEAREQFLRVLASAPEDADATLAVGVLAFQTNRFDEAQRYLERYLVLQPDNDQVRLYLGQLAEQEKHFDDADRHYREIDSPRFAFEAQLRRAVLTANRGNVNDALTQLRALKPVNDEQRLQSLLAGEQVLREAKRYDEAYRLLTDGLRQLPDNHDLLYARALIAEKLNRVADLERDLRRILARDPKNANALNALGYTLADRTPRVREGLALIEKALMLKPDDPFILDSLGWAHFRLGDHAQAVKHLRSALEKRYDPEIAAHLGEVLWAMGDRAGAEQVWEGALRKTPNSDVLLSVVNRFKGKAKD